MSEPIEVRIGAKLGDQTETFGLLLDHGASRQEVRRALRAIGEELYVRIKRLKAPRQA